MSAGKSLTAKERTRERWHIAPSPRANVVNPMLFVAPVAEQHAAPCWKCEARGPCRHREFVDA